MCNVSTLIRIGSSAKTTRTAETQRRNAGSSIIILGTTVSSLSISHCCKNKQTHILKPSDCPTMFHCHHHMIKKNKFILNKNPSTTKIEKNIKKYTQVCTVYFVLFYFAFSISHIMFLSCWVCLSDLFFHKFYLFIFPQLLVKKKLKSY